MKTTHKRAIQAYIVLNQMGRKVSGRTAYALFLLKNELKTVVDFQSEEEAKLTEKYGGQITEEGAIVIADKEKAAAFRKEYAELGNMECEIKGEPATVDLDAAPEVTMQEIEALDGLVKFK